MNYFLIGIGLSLLSLTAFAVLLGGMLDKEMEWVGVSYWVGIAVLFLAAGGAFE